MIRALLLLAILGALVAALALGTARGRDLLREARHAVRLHLAASGMTRTEIFIEAEGARLATDVYLPISAARPLPTLLLRLPYGKRRFGEVLWWLELFGPDHAVVVQDMRGRHRSTGAFEPWRHEGADGAATLDWIAAQDWSNGRVGTAGCSALGETQVSLAMERHPAHAAMIPLGAGGAAGDLDGRRTPFGIFEGGVPALAGGASWFAGDAGEEADLNVLPVRDAASGGWRDLLDGLTDPGFSARMGYATEADRYATPALFVDGWYDPAVAGTLSLARAMRAQGVDASALILPAVHCDQTGGFRDGRVGDVEVVGAAPDLGATFRAFMAAHLSDGPPAPRPPYEVWVMGADRWHEMDSWPPETEPHELHLDGDALSDAPGPTARSLLSDPGDPVPSVGGAICCTDAVLTGPRDQSPIEDRADLLHWTSDPLDALILGAPEVTLTLDVDAPDADLIVRLTELRPDGRSLPIAVGALRLRYRDGIDAPAPLPDGPFEATVTLSPIAWRMAPGARLRLHVAGASFPRLARNMQGGGDPHLEDMPRPARIEVLGGRITLP